MSTATAPFPTTGIWKTDADTPATVLWTDPEIRMTPKATVAVDIDSTLYDFETPAREAFAKLAEERGDKSLLRGAYHPWTEWRSPADACGLEVWLDAIAMVHANDVILDQTPFPGSVETCAALVSEGYDLLYVSNRATESYDATLEWLHNCGFPQADSLICNQFSDKKAALADCRYLIDDRPKTVVEFVFDYDWALRKGAEEPRKAFVPAYPYNQNLTDIPNVYLAPTWAGLNSYMVSKGVLSEPAYRALA